MGRKAKYNVKSLKIGQKLPFPKRREEYIYQYLNNFRESTGWDFEKVIDEYGNLFVRRTA